jgi:hypothetical protein
MSNTAVRISVIPDAAFQSKNVMAFDWFFYTSILANGALARVSSKTVTYYRQHANNIAAIRNPTDCDIVRGLKIKRDHFDVFDPVYAAELLETENWISQNRRSTASYCTGVREAMRSQPFWWESIKTFKELGL